MATPENLGNLRFAIQSAQGSPAASSAYGLYLAGGTIPKAMRTEESLEESTGQRMRSDRYVSEAHAAGAPELFARPLSVFALLYGVLGAKAVSGAGDPFTHTATPATSRPWFTLWPNTGGLILEQLNDCKVDQLVISGESGKPLRVTPTFMGIDADHQTAPETTAAIETADRLDYYDGDGALQLQSTAIASIRAFTMTISNNGELIPGDGLEPIDISEGELTVQIALTRLLLNATLRDELYYGPAPANDADVVSDILELAATGVDFKFTSATGPERSLQLAVPRMAVAPIEVDPGTGNSPLLEALTLDSLQPTSGDAITATVLNAQATY